MPRATQKPGTEVGLLYEALRALNEKTGLRAQLVSTNETTIPSDAADAVVDVAANGQAHRYTAHCKFHVDRKSAISQLQSALSALPYPGLMIVPYVSREIADYCRETNLQFIDTHGNAYLNAPGMYVYVKGEKDPTGRTVTRGERGTANAAALRVAFILLCDPALVQASYRNLMESAGVSLGAISSTFDDLKRRGLLLNAEGGHRRQLLEPKRLFDEWIINYPVVLRHKLNPRRFSAPDPNWWQHVQPAALNAVWGSEVAAERITGYLKPASQTLYVEPTAMQDCLKHLVSRHRLRPDPDGQVEVLEKFWNLPSKPESPDLAPDVLVYTDLMATLDPRNNEAARLIWETRIEAALAQA